MNKRYHQQLHPPLSLSLCLLWHTPRHSINHVQRWQVLVQRVVAPGFHGGVQNHIKGQSWNEQITGLARRSIMFQYTVDVPFYSIFGPFHTKRMVFVRPIHHGGVGSIGKQFVLAVVQIFPTLTGPMVRHDHGSLLRGSGSIRFHDVNFATHGPTNVGFGHQPMRGPSIGPFAGSPDFGRGQFCTNFKPAVLLRELAFGIDPTTGVVVGFIVLSIVHGFFFCGQDQRAVCHCNVARHVHFLFGSAVGHLVSNRPTCGVQSVKVVVERDGPLWDVYAHGNIGGGGNDEEAGQKVQNHAG